MFLSLVLWTWVLGPVGAILAFPLALLVKPLLIDVDPERLDCDAPDQHHSRARAGGRMNLSSVIVTVRRFIAIDGYDGALALVAKAFVAVVPLVLVLAAWAPAGARQRAGAELVEGMGLDGATAAVVRQLVARPPDASEPVTVVGLVLLVFSVLGFARSLQRTFEAAWELPRSGLRGYGPGLLGAAVFIGEVVALVLLTEAVHAFSVNVVVMAVVRAVVGALAWWPVQRLLVDGRVPWRDLLPGAIVTGVGQAVVMALAALTLRPVLIDQAQRFGVIGAAFALVTGLTVFGVLLVLEAVLGPVVAGRAGVTQPRAVTRRSRPPTVDTDPGR
jgi:membrane protein